MSGNVNRIRAEAKDLRTQAKELESEAESLDCRADALERESQKEMEEWKKETGPKFGDLLEKADRVGITWFERCALELAMSEPMRLTAAARGRVVTLAREVIGWHIEGLPGERAATQTTEGLCLHA